MGEKLYVARETTRDLYATKFHDFFCHQDWNVGVVREPIDVFLEPNARPEVQWFPPIGPGRYLADPFGIVRQGSVYVLCEAFDYRSQKGVIAWTRLSEEGLPVARDVAIEMPFHMSYPCIIERNGDTYCVPETYRAREISLYKADRFPTEWTKVSTLVPDFAGVDSTVFNHQGRWWIACTNKEWGEDDRLFLWHAPDLAGPFLPHPQNPVKKGRTGTRPAGTPFVHKGELFRPAMDSARTYGERIIINRITKLSPTDFEEEPAGVLEPFRMGRYRYGVHTLSAVGRWTLVDGLSVTFEKSEFKRAWEKESRKFLRSFVPLLHKG